VTDLTINLATRPGSLVSLSGEIQLAVNFGSGVFGKELSDGDRIRFELEVQNSVSVTQFLPKDPTTE
jgi:hypothetical protein